MSQRKEPKLRALILARYVMMALWLVVTVVSLSVSNPGTLLMLLLVSFGWAGWCLATTIAFSLLGRLVIHNETRTREEKLIELDYTSNRVLLAWFAIGVILLSVFLVNHFVFKLV